MAVKLALRRSSLYISKRCRPLLLQGSFSSRYSSDFSNLRKEMVSRRLPYLIDVMTPTQTICLTQTLHDFLPSPGESRERLTYEYAHDAPLRPGHHLVYFPALEATSDLLPDGTDILHSPGPPFTRRMWAGGSMEFKRSISANGYPYRGSETIQDVQIRGKEGEERIFVKIQRVLFPSEHHKELKHEGLRKQSQPGIRIQEYRTLVFMRDNSPKDSTDASPRPRPALKPTLTPHFSHTMVPTRELLFRFSALTFNAHAIHLDKAYCREKEGHRNLLVHGPLTALLMLEVLQRHLENPADSENSLKREPDRIKSIEYRNLAPLYAEEKMKICVRRKEKATDRGMTDWVVWIEGPDGGYAVKGTVSTSSNQPLYWRSLYKPNGRLSENEEHIPKENVEFQHQTNAESRDGAREEDTLREDVAADDHRIEEAEK